MISAYENTDEFIINQFIYNTIPNMKKYWIFKLNLNILRKRNFYYWKSDIQFGHSPDPASKVSDKLP
jgi:hypothetical protein